MLHYVIYCCDVRNVASGKLVYRSKKSFVSFNDAVSSWNYTASRDRMINKLNEKNMEEVSLGYSKVPSQHLHWETAEKHKKTCQDS